MSEETTGNISLRQLREFGARLNIRPIYFVLPVILSLVAAFFEGASIGLLIPTVKGIADKNFGFVKEQVVFKKIALLWPAISDFSNVSILIMLIGVIVAAAVIKNVLQYASTTAVSFQVRRISNNMRKLIFNRYLGFGKLFFDRSSIGHLHTILMGFTQRIISQLTVTQQLLNNLFMLIIYLFIMFVISWKLTILVMLLSPVLYYSLHFLIDKIKKTSNYFADSEKELSKRLFNILSCMTLIKSYTQEEEEKKNFAAASDLVEGLEFSIDKKQNLVSPIQEIIILVAMLLLICGMAIMVMKERTSEVAGFLVYFYLIRRTSATFGAVNNMRSQMARVDGPIREILNVLDDRDKHFVADGTKDFKGLKEKIEFKDLRFSYIKGVEVLRGVSTSIGPGKMTAIVGPTGAGKTTLINLILRIYDCPASSILINGIDIRQFNLKTLRAHMALVSQETLLFNDTFKNNIIYGLDGNVSEARVMEVVKKARLYDFIATLPAGLDTQIGDRGVTLSGGEKQRVSIARALVKGAEILLLDEATSSLDSATERLIQEAIDEAIKARTAIVIAHRLSTIKHADKIIVMENGSVVEEGTLDELLAKKGKFFGYWEAQKFY